MQKLERSTYQENDNKATTKFNQVKCFMDVMKRKNASFQGKLHPSKCRDDRLAVKEHMKWM